VDVTQTLLIQAGSVLAQAIVREMKASPDFQRDFAEVNAEAAAAQNSLQVISQSFITRMAPACHVLVTSKCRISAKI
jgi:hypothetical protein